MQAALYLHASYFRFVNELATRYSVYLSPGASETVCMVDIVGMFLCSGVVC